MKKNPQMDMETMKSLLSSDSLVREVSLGGRTIDGNVQFFYALIAMACCMDALSDLALRSGSRLISHLWQPDGV